MRPVRLEAEGFTCYRDRQAPLEFAGLSLFAIAGPTGAGKSSILDAILFALYGEVPRIGKQGTSELIAQGRDAMSVTLDFQVRGQTYRVMRRVTRRANGTLKTAALLEQIEPEAKSLAENVRPVNEAVLTLLGLDFDAFTKTVILPQGEFARFLKAEPKEQRAILQHLLRHEIYERMRVEAERRRVGVNAELAGVDRELRAYEAATPEALSEKCEARDRAAVHSSEAAARAAELDAAVGDLRVRHDLTAEARRLRLQRGGLEARTPDIERQREALASARRAAGVLPRLDAVAQATALAARADTLLGSARTAHDGDEQRLADATVALATATARAAERPALEARIRAIDEIKGDLSRRAALRTRVTELAASRPAAHATAERAQAALASARAQHAEAAERRRTAIAERDSAGFNQEELRAVEEAWPIAAQVRAADHDLASLEPAAVAAQAERVRADKRAVTSDKACDAASAAYDAAVSTDASASLALDEGRADHQAAALRSHLHAGEACPVCLQAVAVLPDAPSVPELARLTTARQAAATTLAEARTALQSAREARVASRSAHEAAQRAADAAGTVLARKQQARTSLLAQLAAALAGFAGLVQTEALLDFLDAQRARVLTARTTYERAEKSVRGAEAGASAAALAEAQAEAALRTATDQATRRDDEERDTRSELAQLESRIASVSTHADPSVERDEFARRASALERALQSAQAARSAADAQVSASHARMTAAAAQLDTARIAETGTQAVLLQALADAGFASADVLRAAVLDDESQRRLETAIRGWEVERTTVVNRLLDIEPLIAGREVDAAALAAGEAEQKAARSAVRAAEIAHAALITECTRLEADVQTRTRLDAERAVLEASQVLCSGMASDLKGDAFQEYLLEEAFHGLVRGASVRLRQMSNRYTLEWHDSDFFVVDHDNAGDTRRAETLSGGETFMASLCLALQLSDEVLKTSGALQMDSLFIDEGFGTLDAESLADVTDAMEALREDGARLIGVISHRPELTERLPGCIRVVKGAGESTWLLERQG